MKIYQVGGAVRDRLLGLPVHDIDYVVVGSSVEEMLAKGFRPVGSYFPVFLHPQTQHEYALARTERKTAPGHQGFAFHADPGISLEEDLIRRDLTINAMAYEVNDAGELVGGLIDPYAGKTDLERGVFRHLSEAFTEDPLRVLRVARFAARFPGFQIAPKTLELMKEMVAKGDLQTLSKERIWQELARAFAAPAPLRFIEVLEECGALQIVWPDSLLEQWSNFAIKEKMVTDLMKVAMAHPQIDKRLAIFLKRLHPEQIKDWSIRLRVPNELTDFCHVVAVFEAGYDKEPDPKVVLDMFNRTDVWRKSDRFVEALQLVGSVGRDTHKWQRALEAAIQVDGGKIAADIAKQSSNVNRGEEIHDALTNARLAAITKILHQ